MKKTASILKKTIFLSMVLFLFFVVTNCAKASEINYNEEFDKECSLRNCTVPIPTLDKPNNQIIYFDEKFYLTGLTWNDTEIDIYINGIYKGSATVVNDEDSDIANFYYQIDEKTLFKGTHDWEVIAWSKNRRDRSFVSSDNKFEIQLRLIPDNTTIQQNKTQEIILDEMESGESDTSSINEKEINVNIIGDEVPGKVIVNTDIDSDSMNVNIVKSEEVVQDISAINEGKEIENIDTEMIQPATPDENNQDIIESDLDLSNNQIRNKKLGIFLLLVLVVVVIFTIIFTKKKKTNTE